MEQPSFFTGWTEPESAANTAYPPQAPYNTITATESGHTFELDDTKGRERVRLMHRTGTFIEMHPNGDEVHKVYGNGYEITIKDKNVLVEGNCNLTINGDANINIKGDKVEYVEGNYELHVKKNFSVLTEGLTDITSQNDMSIRAGAAITGTLTLGASDCVFMKGDISLDGELNAAKITSRGRVDAATGMSAGPLGFVTALGGVSVGLPVAVPLNIFCAQSVNAGLSVNAGASVNAPTGNFGVMSAILMTDNINTTIYGSHFHATSRGPTSPPIGPMI
jgi:hypothetical protein